MQWQRNQFIFGICWPSKQENSCGLSWEISSFLLYRARLHESEFPNMPVQILESMTVHKAVVLRLVVSFPAGGDGLANDLVDFISTARRQAHQNFGAPRCIANLLWREDLEFVMRQQHGVDVFTDDHAGGGFISKLRIEGEAELAKEGHGLLEIFYR